MYWPFYFILGTKKIVYNRNCSDVTGKTTKKIENVIAAKCPKKNA